MGSNFSTFSHTRSGVSHSDPPYKLFGNGRFRTLSGMLTDVQHLLGEYSVGLLQVWLLPGMLTFSCCRSTLDIRFLIPQNSSAAAGIALVHFHFLIC